MTALQDTSPAQTAPAQPASLPETPASFSDDLPEWMTALQDASPAQTAPAEPVSLPETPASDDLPDWMTALQDTSPPQTVPAQPVPLSESPTSPTSSADDLPDWMKALQDSSSTPVMPISQPSLSESPTLVIPPADDLPDWMATLTPATTEPAQSEPASRADLSSRLGETLPGKPTDDEAGLLSKPFDTASLNDVDDLTTVDKLPSWMSRLGTPAEPASAFPESDSNALEIPADTADLPDWLAGISAEAATLASRPETAQESPSASSEIIPELTSGENSLASTSDEQNLDSIFEMDTPDWLSGFTPSEAGGQALQDAEFGEDASLSRAELPSWVQAMRPMESVMAEAGDSDEGQEIENHGPLAGLRSVLPVQTGMAEIHKSSAYSIKLLASETQMAQAALLDNLLNSENTPQKVARRVGTNNIRPLRWLIAAVLLLAVLVPALLGPQMRIFPVVPPADSSASDTFFTTIGSLPAGAPVLVVVDYQPGFAGELETVAGPVITQLTDKGIPLAFISTSPVGTFMSDRLLQKFASSYVLRDQYVNFGYLPGGAGGIKAFAEQPAVTVGHDTLLGDMWKMPAMVGATVNEVTSLTNFSALIVVTDNPDTGRLWIEQAGPLLGTQRPMLMVVSAQAEPMIRPYLLSKQLTGLVTGLEGGALYEASLGKETLNGPHTYWDAFGMGMLAIELLIIIGGVWGLITGLRARRTAIEQDEA